MTRNYNHYNYFKSKDSGYSFNQMISIQPAFWGQKLGGHIFFLDDLDCIPVTQKITVYYQMGNSFKFTVPLNLSINSITFDALDSSLLPQEDCLKENSRWWIINGTSVTINSMNPAAATNCSIQTFQTEECKVTHGSSFFQFGYSDIISDISKAGTLNITNWVFQNFYYDFTSLIGFANGHGDVVINNTTFDRFSNWGSIIRDTQELPVLDYTGSSSTNSQVLITNRDSIFSINQIQNKYLIQPSYPWMNSTWASIRISNWIFTNFNYMKSGGWTFHKVSKNSKMKYQGVVLNLNQFYGDIALWGNQFIGLTFKYNNCEEVYNPQPTSNPDSIFGDPAVLQLKTLIYIAAKSESIEIFNNSFSHCNSLQGLIFIERYSDSSSIMLIYNNTFIQNSAIFGSNVLKISLFTNISYTMNFTSSDKMICAGVKIASNTFTRNIGWFNTTAAVQAFWFTNSVDYENYIDNSLEYPMPMLNIPSQNLSK